MTYAVQLGLKWKKMAGYAPDLYRVLLCILTCVAVVFYCFSTVSCRVELYCIVCCTVEIERFSFELRKTKAKVITLVN